MPYFTVEITTLIFCFILCDLVFLMTDVHKGLYAQEISTRFAYTDSNYVDYTANFSGERSDVSLTSSLSSTF